MVSLCSICLRCLFHSESYIGLRSYLVINESWKRIVPSERCLLNTLLVVLFGMARKFTYLLYDLCSFGSLGRHWRLDVPDIHWRMQRIIMSGECKAYCKATIH
jgi:hypothetical protein